MKIVLESHDRKVTLELPSNYLTATELLEEFSRLMLAESYHINSIKEAHEFLAQEIE